MVPLALAVKAEVVMGAHLVLRHRAPRLATLLALLVVVLAVLRDVGDTSGTGQAGTVFVIGGTLAAVGASRLLAPGAALAGARRVAALWWLVPTGRLIGALLVIAPIAGIAALTLGPHESGPGTIRLALIGTVYTAAMASVILACAPALGASAAAAVGLSAAWIGGLPPSAILNALDRWPLAQRPLGILWNLLPLNWRAVRWLQDGLLADGFVLLSWIALGILAAAWITTASAHRSNGLSPGVVE